MTPQAEAYVVVVWGEYPEDGCQAYGVHHSPTIAAEQSELLTRESPEVALRSYADVTEVRRSWGGYVTPLLDHAVRLMWRHEIDKVLAECVIDTEGSRSWDGWDVADVFWEIPTDMVKDPDFLRRGRLRSPGLYDGNYFVEIPVHCEDEP